MDNKTTIEDLKQQVKKFCDDRDWDQFHNAKNLATALIIEAAELLEHFRWDSDKEVESRFKDSAKREEIEDETADVLYFIIRLAQMYNIDLSEAIKKKLIKNDKNYPVDKAKGSAKKYTELQK